MSVDIWPLLRDEEVLNTPVFSVRRHTCRSPKDGGDKNFFILDARDWAQVIAVTADEQVVLVRQFRQGSRELSLELPGGVVEKGQTPLEAAQRELREETGYTSNQWSKLTSFLPNPAIQTNTAHLFLAENACLTDKTEFDENEDLELVTVPASQLGSLVNDGGINHVVMAAGILYYLQRCREDDRPDR